MSYKRNRNARQAGATVERPPSNALYAVRNFYARQAGATVERILSDARYTSGEGNVRKTRASLECGSSDGLYCAGDGYTCNIGTIIKREISYSRDLIAGGRDR